MKKELQRAWAIERLRQKAARLRRLPNKGDFSEADRARIKAFLGPWPRALEQAGLKERRKKRRNNHPPLAQRCRGW